MKFLGVAKIEVLWITEWGVLNRGDDNPALVSEYAMSMLNHVSTHYNDDVSAMIWYAWAESMHNGYGIATQNI